MDSTLLLAIYGVILGTLGFTLSVYLAIREYKKERRILKVIIEYIAFYEYLQIRIVNTNFRPITISSVGGWLLEKKGFKWTMKESIPDNALLDIPKPNFPVTLKDGESTTIKLQQGMLSYFWDEVNRIKVYVHDSEGNMYFQTERKMYNAKFNRYEKV